MIEERDIIRDVVSFSELVADAVIKRLRPIDDDLSTREAQTLYGRSWLSHHIERGNAHGHRVGNAVVFSRHELDAIRVAERQYFERIKPVNKQ